VHNNIHLVLIILHLHCFAAVIASFLSQFKANCPYVEGLRTAFNQRPFVMLGRILIEVSNCCRVFFFLGHSIQSFLFTVRLYHCHIPNFPDLSFSRASRTRLGYQPWLAYSTVFFVHITCNSFLISLYIQTSRASGGPAIPREEIPIRIQFTDYSDDIESAVHPRSPLVSSYTS
jgi:hypothetical protein